MGDCRIRILIAQNLLSTVLEKDDKSFSAHGNDSNHQSQWHEVINQLFSSDTTIREVLNHASSSQPYDILSLLTTHNHNDQNNNNNNNHKVVLWDCTSHPPMDITDWPLEKYKDIQGAHSKTLYDAGWFPSGTLRLSWHHEGPPLAISQLQQEDVQYNNTTLKTQPSNTNTNAAAAAPAAVQFVGTTSGDTPLLPSQVLESVTKRFENNNNYYLTETSEQDALRERRHNQQVRHQKEQERCVKLEARIQKLDKTTKVSDQVRRMLIKSRATGSNTLKQQDRVYFRMVVIMDDDHAATTTNTDISTAATTTTTREEYRYFSIQDTIGRGILSTLTDTSNTPRDWQSELLVRRPVVSSDNNNNSNNNTTMFRRLPNSMRVYEAISRQYLEPHVNDVVVRWYSSSGGQEATTSVLDDNDNQEQEMSVQATQEETNQKQVADEKMTTPTPQNNGSNNQQSTTISQSSLPAEENVIHDNQLADWIRHIDEQEQSKSSSTSKKKSSSSKTSTKVRQMLMKTKAKGDAKRIKNMQDRFFFELITCQNRNQNCESMFCYLSNTDPLGRILPDCVTPCKASSDTTTCQQDPDLLVVMTGTETSHVFRRLTNHWSMSFQEAEKAKLIQPFDRLIVRFP